MKLLVSQTLVSDPSEGVSQRYQRTGNERKVDQPYSSVTENNKVPPVKCRCLLMRKGIIYNMQRRHFCCWNMTEEFLQLVGSLWHFSGKTSTGRQQSQGRREFSSKAREGRSSRDRSSSPNQSASREQTGREHSLHSWASARFVLLERRSHRKHQQWKTDRMPKTVVQLGLASISFWSRSDHLLYCAIMSRSQARLIAIMKLIADCVMSTHAVKSHQSWWQC